MEDAEATEAVSLKSPCLKILFLTIFKQGKDKHKHASGLEKCLSSVKIADFRGYEFLGLKVSHKLLTAQGFLFGFSGDLVAFVRAAAQGRRGAQTWAESAVRSLMRTEAQEGRFISAKIMAAGGFV